MHGRKDQRMIAIDMSIIFFHDCETSEVLSELEYTVSDGCFFFNIKTSLLILVLCFRDQTMAVASFPTFLCHK